MNPGEYVSPLTRKTLVNCPVVSGYVTARLQSQDYFPPSLSGSNSPTAMLVSFVNVGQTQISVLLQETADRSISGARTTLAGTSVTLVPGGQKTVVTSNLLPFVEVYCSNTQTNATGVLTYYPGGNLMMQIDSQRRWQEMGFDRNDPFYPPVLFEAAEVPGPL